MASGQEHWATPALTTRNSPQLQPAYVDPAASPFSTLDANMEFPSAYDDASWLGLPQRVSPPEVMRDHDQGKVASSRWPASYTEHAIQQPWSQGPQQIPPQSNVAPVTHTQQRIGVSPQQRERLGQAELPSLEDQDRIRKLDEELAKVRSWLEQSALNSDSLMPNSTSEGRARSHTSPAPPATSMMQPPTLRIPQAAQRGSSAQPFSRAIPGPGAVLQVPEDDEDDESFDVNEEQLFPISDSTTPPAFAESLLRDDQSIKVGYSAAGADKASHYHGNAPWTDCPDDVDSARIKEQPPSSNDAIGVFMRKAKDMETASLAATLGSRRRSEADLMSLASRDGANIGGSSGAPQSSLFRRFIRRNSNYNAKKRKDDEGDDSAPVSESAAPNRKDSQGGLSLKRVISRPKSPRLETGVDQHQHHSGLSPTLDKAKKTLQRMRSKSDLNAGSNFNSALAKEWARQGGPPVPPMRAPQEPEVDQVPHRAQSRRLPSPEDGDGDDDGLQDTSASMSMQVGEAPLAADREAFKAHISKLNPRIEPYMLNRLTNEQDKRFRRLVDARMKHRDAVSRGSCVNGDLCNDLGKGSRYPPPSTSRTADSCAPIFWIPGRSSPNDGSEQQGEKAHFPAGIPVPPVVRLPAEFECPLCFQVKKISKPSDWTKHVNEDIQPFTCTFAECNEAKSFKRKADWVRHESERHRHLEAWQCDLNGCYHRCYRRDNFVQHLVREHRLPEPTKVGKSAYRTGMEPGDEVAHHVERCHEESTNQPEDEPCRFCGNLCASWRKLSVHLAQHMQQISLPILTVVGVDIPPTGPSPMAALSIKGLLKQPHTPMHTSPGSRTPSISMPGSSGPSNPQSSTSSGEGWDVIRTPTVSVTDTSQTLAAPQIRQRAATVTPSFGRWPQGQMNRSGREASRYPVMGPPPGAQQLSPSGLGVNLGAEAAQQQTYQPQSQVYGNSPLTPQTPVAGGQTPTYGGTPQPQYDGMWTTYPPPGMTSGSVTTQPPPAQVQNILHEPSFMDSPVDTSVPEFPDFSSMGGVPSYQQAMTGQGQDEDQFYDMPSDMQFTLGPEQGQVFAQSRSSYVPPSVEEDQPQSYHSATYPPQYYHP